MPSGHIVQLFNDSGTMQYTADGRTSGTSGTNRLAGSGYVAPQANAHCFLVGVLPAASKPGDPPVKFYFNNSREFSQEEHQLDQKISTGKLLKNLGSVLRLSMTHMTEIILVNFVKESVLHNESLRKNDKNV